MNAAGSAKRAPLAIPGRLFVSSTDPAVVELDVAAGWMTPRGILGWTREVSVVAKSEVTDSLRRELSLAQPHEHISVVKHPTARRAAQANPVAAVASSLGATLSSRGVRVHTIGYDKVTANFFYFAEGGTAQPVHIQGDLLEMIAPVLAYGNENDDIARHLARLIDRIVSALSGGVLTELRVELAEALPPLAAKGSITPDLDAFEREATGLTTESAKWRGGAESLASTLESASSRKEQRVPVHLFGEATRVTRTAMDLDVGGHRIALPSRTLWVVSGEITDKPPASAPPPPAAEVDEAWGEESEAPATAQPAKTATPKPAETKPIEAKPAAAKPVETKPVEAKPAETRPSTAKPVEAKPAESRPSTAKPVEAKPVEAKPVEAKPVVETRPAEPKPIESKPIEVRPSTPKSPEVRPSTPKQPEVKRPTPAVGTPRPAIATPSPRPAVASSSPKPGLATPRPTASPAVPASAPVSAPGLAAVAIESKEAAPVQAVVAQRTVQLGTPMPTAVVSPVAPSTAHTSPEDDEDDDDDTDASEVDAAAAPSAVKDDRGSKHSSKAAAKRAAKAAKRAAAKEANRAANAPKPKKKTEPEVRAASSESRLVAADADAPKAAAVAKSTKSDAQLSSDSNKKKSSRLAPVEEPTPPPAPKSSARTLQIIIAIAIAVGFLIFYFVVIKK